MEMRPSMDCSQTTSQGSVQLTEISPNSSSAVSDASITDRPETTNNFNASNFKLSPDKLTNAQTVFPLPSLYPMNSWFQTFSPNAPLQETLNRIYHSFFGLFERQLSQRLEQFAHRLDTFQREQAATKYQLGRLERLLYSGLEVTSNPEENKPVSENNGCSDEPTSSSSSWYDMVAMNTLNGQKHGAGNSPFKLSNRFDSPLLHPSQPIPGIPPNMPLSETQKLPVERNFFCPLSSPPPSLRDSNPLTRPTPISIPANMNCTNSTLFHSSIQSQLFWNQWMADWFRASSSLAEGCPPSTTTCSFTAILEKIRATDTTATTSTPTCTTTSSDWQEAIKSQSINTPYRPCKLARLRGRRLRGHGRNIWSHLYDGTRNAAFKRAGPYTRPGFNGSQFAPSLGFLKDFNLTRGKIPEGHSAVSHEPGRQFNGLASVENEQNGSHGIQSDTKPLNYAHMYDQGCFSTRTPSSSHASPTKSTNLVGNPIVILNPKEPREIFIGGIHSVPLPLWAYKKCLTMVRGEPHELGPRLCLRLLQSLFSLNYLVTHNYNGSGGKAPIDPTVMGAVLRQAQIQFGSGYFFTEPMALGKLRDYLNNAFRVMAFRQRKGERVRSPFWNDQGEPVHGLEAPVEFADTSDVIVLTPNTEVGNADLLRLNDRPNTPAIDTAKPHENNTL